MIDPSEKFSWRTVIIVAGGYFVFGVIWILISDKIFGLISLDKAELGQWQTYKGTTFVVLSTALIGVLLWIEVARKRRLSRYWLAILDQAPEGFWLIDPQARTIQVNETLAELLGYTPEEMKGHTPYEFVDEENLAIFKEQIGKISSTKHRHYEINLRTRQGGGLPAFFHSTTFRDGNGNLLGSCAFVTDLTQQKKRERDLAESRKALQHTNSILRTLSRANKVIISARDESDLLENLCGVLVNEGGYIGAWIGFQDDSQPPRLHIQAGCLGEGAIQAVPAPLILEPVGPDPGPVFQVMNQKETMQVPAADLPPEIRPEAGTRNHDSPPAALLPLGEERRRGILIICSNDRSGFTDRELDLIHELAANLDYGVGAQRLQVERQRHLERLLQSAAVFDNSGEAIFITTADQRILAVNEAFTRITGYSEDEVLGHPPALWQSGLHDRPFYRRMWQELREKDNWQGEIWNRQKNGENFPGLETISAVRDEKGQLINYVFLLADITQIRQTEEKLNFFTYYDPLTLLPNRTLFRERLELALSHIYYGGRPLAVVHLDIVGFRAVNESLGKEAGDAILMQVSERLQANIREGDTVARSGGDDFWVLLSDLRRSEDAEQVVRILQDAVSQPLSIGQETVRPKLTAGIALAPQDCSRSDDLLTAAANALHRSQDSGWTIQYFQATMGEQARHWMRLKEGLNEALEREELEVWYQPQVELATGHPVAAEALVRWRHPQWGLVSPGTFIPVAEEVGLIKEIGEWVLSQAADQCAAWREAESPIRRVSINVAPGQIQGPGLAQCLDAVLVHTGLPADALELEVTEDSFLGNIEEARVVLNGLAARGVRLAIDDFGTGYSSLAYLKGLPVDTLKIDKVFVDGLPNHDQDRCIVEAILAVARTLELAVIPEGIETRAQADWFRQQGVRLGQGFLYAKPTPAAEISADFPPL